MIKQCMVQFKGWILLHIALGFIIQALGALEIVKLQEILDTAVAGSPLKTLTTLIVMYGLLRGAAAVLNYVDEYPSALLANGIPERLKVLALAKISRMDYQAYQNIGTGQMIKVIENGAAAGGGMLNSFVLQTLHELLPTILFSLIFLGFYDMRIMLVIASGYAVVFVIAGRLLKVLYRMKSSILAEQEAVSRYSVRGFMELVVFRLNKRYNREIAAIHASAQHLVRQSARLQMIHESFFAIFEVFITVIKVGVLLYGVRSIVAGGTSPGVLVALIMFIDKVYTPIAIFNVLFVNYKLNRVAYERFAEFIHAPEDRNLHTGLAVQELRGDIELKDVSFAYGSNSVLRELTVSIAGGTTVALVGLSGSGKSTVAKLLAGLLKKSGGSILLDGRELDELSLDSYYDHLSYLSQDSPVFDTTIRGNIDFDQRLTDEELYNVLDKVSLMSKILALPDQLDTEVGERGLKLSGGERQRLAIARAIVQQRSLIILDEPVSALDNITEKRIMETVLHEFREKTVLIVAHRLNFIQKADQILMLEHGALVGQGDFASLLRDSVPFRRLWNDGRTAEAAATAPESEGYNRTPENDTMISS